MENFITIFEIELKYWIASMFKANFKFFPDSCYNNTALDLGDPKEINKIANNIRIPYNEVDINC